jgi:hypothetical protein
MVQIAGNYYKLGDYAEVELYASKAKCALEADGLTKCYAFAECKRNLYFLTVHYVIVTTRTVSHVSANMKCPI